VLDRPAPLGEAAQRLRMVCELKIDATPGLSYERGVLVRAAAAGDGESGERSPPNVRHNPEVPLRLLLDDPPVAGGRGESPIPR